jgi:NAD(P)-dependent dehydrogenase (short-subunit alcohol dehydrogenase family)
MPHFIGKKVLITGAGKNQSIGQAIAHGFAHAGADIIITCHTNPQEAEIIINEISTIKQFSSSQPILQ